MNNAYNVGNNFWNQSYPVGGNYWDDYEGKDEDDDGIGDEEYVIPGIGNSKDWLPHMEPVN